VSIESSGGRLAEAGPAFWQSRRNDIWVGYIR
jgi:hypothetical protein